MTTCTVQRRRGFKSRRWQEVAIFRQNLLTNSPKWEIFIQEFRIIGRKFGDNPKFRGGGRVAVVPRTLGTTPLAPYNVS